MYMPRQGDKIYFSSYGEDGKNGKDIYFAIRMPNGTFTKPQPLTDLNTPYDEDFPFLHPNGKVLYFASKGYNSMGGYDIFKSTYNESTHSWSPPENLEFPINSPDDDFLFVTDSSEKIAFFSTARYAPPGKIDVLKIKTERVPPAYVVIKGNVRKTEINQSVRSVIAVKNIETGELVGTYAADENGEYYMELPNGGKFLFTVETPGFTKQSEAVNLPLSYVVKPFRQSISYEKNILVITNYFDEKSSENNYLDIVELIEKKAQLDVNEEQFKQSIQTPIANVSKEKDELKEKSDRTTATQENKNNNELSASNTPIPPNNTKELIEIIKRDADELNSEIQELENQNNQLKQIIQIKEQEIAEIDKNIQDTKNQITSAETSEEKQQLEKLLQDLQDKKKNTEEQKNFFSQYQQEVTKNIDNKKKEADLNLQFLSTLQELEKSKNNKTTLTKLENIQKELQKIEKQKKEQSDALILLNQQEQQKQAELSKIEQQKNNKEQNIQLLQSEINSLKSELASTKDKNMMENLQIQIKEKESELQDNQKQLSAINEQYEDVKEELQSIREQKDLVAKIKNNQVVAISPKNKQTNTPSTLITNANINQINTEYVNIINASKTDEEKIKNIEAYNKLLMKSIEENKKQLTQTTNQTEKQKLLNLNSEMEQILKSNNDQLIALKNKNNITNPPNIAANNQNQNANNNPPSNSISNNNLSNQSNIAANNQNINNNPQSNNSSNNNNKSTNPSQITINNQNPNNNININNNQQNTTPPTPENLPLTIHNQKEIIQNITENEKVKSEYSALKNQFENQVYQSPLVSSYKQNIPDLPANNPIAKNITEIINAQNQINFFTNQKDSLKKVATELKAKANKTTDNNQKQKLLNDAKKADVAALEKEYQAAQFTKILNQNTFQLYEQTYNQLPENQKQLLAPEINKSAQNIKQAEQIRKEAQNQNNLTIKIAAEQNAQEKEQIALNNLSKIFSQNNIALPPTNFTQNIQQQKRQIDSNYINLQKQFITANNTEIAYLMGMADTSQKIKNNPAYAQSLNQLKNIQKNIETQIASNQNNPSKESQNNILNNQLQLLQQLRQIINAIQPTHIANNNYISKEINYTHPSSNINKDTALALIQNIPPNISVNSNQQLQTLIQEQNQIEDNLKTNNPVLKQKDEIIKNNEILNTEITQLTNKALDLKQKITQTTDQRKRAELQTEFERTNALIQEKKLIQISNEILINQTEYASQQNLIDQLINSIPSNKSAEKNSANNTINEIQKLKKQEETLIKEALSLSNPSAQLGALQNVKIKQQEYLQIQQQLINQLQQYNPNAKKQPLPININDPLPLALKYQANLNKQIKEWEAINNNLNLEITRLYPKYSNTPAGKLLADAQKLITESKNTSDLNKKLELLIKAAQLQQKAMQQLSAPAVSTINAGNNSNSNKPANPPAQQPITQNQNQPANPPAQTMTQNQNQPANPPAQQPIAQNQNKPANPPAQQPIAQNQNKPANPPAQETVTQNQNQPANPPAQQPITQNQNKPANPPAQQPITQNQNKPANPPAQQPITQNQNKPANPPAQETVAQNQNKTNTQQKNTEQTTVNFLPQIKSVKISKTPAYSDAKPIPLNPQLPDGLIFSVQVGAFKNPLPNNFFNGISPVFAQTTENNLYRYLVGQMQDVQEAIALKNNFRNLGYTDAFVIAYYNGKRISLSEALELLKKEKQQDVKINPFATTNVLEKANIPTYTTLMQTTQASETTTSATSTIKEAEEINDLYFTIQVGVYGKNVTDATFKYIKPIIRQSINDKFYRYSAGIYDNISQVQKDLNKVIALGMKDAFICAYWNGKRIFYPEAEKLIKENKNIRYAPPQPIIFPNELVAQNIGIINNPTAGNAIVEQSSNAPPFDPTLVFTNNVTKRPEPTPENGVKPDNSGICFRVQIGAFKNRVPKETADKYFKIKDWPIEVHYINGLYIYTVGNFIAPKYAAKLREQMLTLGINDAFITVYKDNQKLFGYEALKYMSQQ